MDTLILAVGAITVICLVVGFGLAIVILRTQNRLDESHALPQITIRQHRDTLEKLYWLAIHNEK